MPQASVLCGSRDVNREELSAQEEKRRGEENRRAADGREETAKKSEKMGKLGNINPRDASSQTQSCHSVCRPEY